MEVYLAISPQNLLKVLDVPKPKGTGTVTSFTVPLPTQSIPAASTLLKVTRAASKKGIYLCFLSFDFLYDAGYLILNSSSVKVVNSKRRGDSLS